MMSLARAKEIGVKKFIFPAIDSSHFDEYAQS